MLGASILDHFEHLQLKFGQKYLTTQTFILRAVRRRRRDPSSICCLRFSRSRRGCRRGSQRSSKLMAANECSRDRGEHVSQCQPNPISNLMGQPVQRYYTDHFHHLRSFLKNTMLDDRYPRVPQDASLPPEYLYFGCDPLRHDDLLRLERGKRKPQIPRRSRGRLRPTCM